MYIDILDLLLLVKLLAMAFWSKVVATTALVAGGTYLVWKTYKAAKEMLASSEDVANEMRVTSELKEELSSCEKAHELHAAEFEDVKAAYSQRYDDIFRATLRNMEEERNLDDDEKPLANLKIRNEKSIRHLKEVRVTATHRELCYCVYNDDATIIAEQVRKRGIHLKERMKGLREYEQRTDSIIRRLPVEDTKATQTE